MAAVRRSAVPGLPGSRARHPSGVRRRVMRLLVVAGVVTMAGCRAVPDEAPSASDDGIEATSLLGQPLARPLPSDEVRAQMEAELADARAAWERAPDNVDAIIWLGRRTAYLGRYREAIGIYTDGITQHPDDARLYRHRGHRYITVRELDQAIADLEHAAMLVEGQPDQVEPDGQPNARNIPTSTLHSNIWYHLALARYLKGDWTGATEGWRRAREAVDNPDNLVAASHWLYLSLMRSGRQVEAEAVILPITSDLDVIENGSYHQLLLLYRGDRTVDDLVGQAGEGASGSAMRYGVSAWHLVHGRQAEAALMWSQILEGPDWPSFGFIAAEADTARRAGAREPDAR